MSESRYCHSLHSVRSILAKTQLCRFRQYAIYQTTIHSRSESLSLFENDREAELARCRSRHAVSTNLRDTLLRSGVTVYFRQQVTSRFQLTPDRSAARGRTFRGGGGRRQCGLSRNRRARSKSIEATWTRNERSLCHAPWKAVRPREFDESERIDNNSAEAACEKDLTLWTLDSFPELAPYRTVLMQLCFIIRSEIS